MLGVRRVSGVGHRRPALGGQRAAVPAAGPSPGGPYASCSQPLANRKYKKGNAGCGARERKKKGKERKGPERKGKERKERKKIGKERKGKEKKGKKGEGEEPDNKRRAFWGEWKGSGWVGL